MTLGEIKSLIDDRLQSRGFGLHMRHWQGSVVHVVVGSELEIIDFKGQLAKARFRVYEKPGMIDGWANRRVIAQNVKRRRLPPVQTGGTLPFQIDLEDAIASYSAQPDGCDHSYVEMALA